MATAIAPHEGGILPDETVDSVVIHGGAGLKDTRARFAARDVRVVDTPVQGGRRDGTGSAAGVRATGGQVVVVDARCVRIPGPATSMWTCASPTR